MRKQESSAFIIGISGASGSGKTFLANLLVKRIAEEFGSGVVGLVQEDSYYNDQAHLSPSERLKTNYDHPDSLDHKLLAEHLRALRRGESVRIPSYDYTTHTRFPNKTVEMTPKRVIVVEGILLFTDEQLRREMDLLVFTDTPLDICILRRAARDATERERTMKSVVSQYLETVRPMYLQYIAPSKRWADVLIPGTAIKSTSVELLIARVERFLRPTVASKL